MSTNVLIIGNGAREHAIAQALAKSNPAPDIFAWMKMENPGIKELAKKVRVFSDYLDIQCFAKECRPDLAIIGPEEPLAKGVADMLWEMGVPTVGPIRMLARLETSKAFARDLMEKCDIPGNPRFQIFNSMSGIEAYLEKNMPSGVVLKPGGLTGGRGVKVQGEHFNTMAEALKICKEILAEHEDMVVDKKLDGEEFILQCFCDGENIVPMPLVQDHKRRLVGDKGLNTGSMGSFSCANHLLPFLTQNELDQATDIIRRTVKALHQETGRHYRGIIYGGFMITKDGVKLIEFNARFGDPEGINVLALLETDFLAICQSITRSGRYDPLSKLDIKFKPLATVCKYVVPMNYGLPEDQHLTPASDLIYIGDLGRASLFCASIYSDRNGYHTTTSRALAVLGTAPDLAEAEKIAEAAACAIKGDVAHRWDIGTADLIARRVRHMEELRK